MSTRRSRSGPDLVPAVFWVGVLPAAALGGLLAQLAMGRSGDVVAKVLLVLVAATIAVGVVMMTGPSAEHVEGPRPGPAPGPRPQGPGEVAPDRGELGPGGGDQDGPREDRSPTPPDTRSRPAPRPPAPPSQLPPGGGAARAADAPTHVVVPTADWWTTPNGGPMGAGQGASRPTDGATAATIAAEAIRKRPVQVAQCPCGSFALDVQRRGDRVFITCRECGGSFDWAPGEAWPGLRMNPVPRRSQT